MTLDDLRTIKSVLDDLRTIQSVLVRFRRVKAGWPITSPEHMSLLCHWSRCFTKRSNAEAILAKISHQQFDAPQMKRVLHDHNYVLPYLWKNLKTLNS
jgi:hypothetical protein